MRCADATDAAGDLGALEFGACELAPLADPSIAGGDVSAFAGTNTEFALAV